MSICLFKEAPYDRTKISKIYRGQIYIVRVPGSFNIGFVWALGASTIKEELAAHVHDYNEVLGWIGTDWKNPNDLGGEIEFWIEDEKYILKNSCIIYIPRGVTHGPLKDLKVDRPFIHFGVIAKNDFNPAS
jgi:hypothetical protein